MNFNFEIISPEKIVYSDQVEEIILQTTVGQITILPNHANLLTQVSPGELIVKKGDNSYSIVVTGGFLEINGNTTTIIADYAIRAQDIEVARVEEAKKRAEKVLQDKKSDKDFKIAQGELLKALLELKVADRHKRRS